MFLWRWKSSIIARNSIWNILFPDQSIKKGRRGRKRDKETRKNPEKDEHYKENGLVKNTLSLVWNCEFKRSVFWMIVEYRMVFKQIGLIFPILWVQYKLGRKCVKRHPLFRLIICTLVKIAKEKKNRVYIPRTSEKDFKVWIILAISTVLLQLVYTWYVSQHIQLIDRIKWMSKTRECSIRKRRKKSTVLKINREKWFFKQVQFREAVLCWYTCEIRISLFRESV